MPVLQSYIYTDLDKGGTVSVNYGSFSPDNFDKKGALVSLLSQDCSLPVGSYSLSWGVTSVTITNQNGVWKGGTSVFVSIPDVANGQGEIVRAETNPLTGGIEVSAGGVAIGIAQVVEQSAVPAALTGTTAETTLATVAIPPMGTNDSVRVTALFTFTSSTNLKTMFGKLNAATFAQNSTTTSGHTAARVQWQVTNRNNTASQLGTPYGMGFTAGAAVSPLNTAVETSGDNTLLIRGQLASGAETLTLEGYTIELIRG